MKDTSIVISSLIVSLQPLNPRQAMVKRLSVVNLENFKRQYARRRWKVNYTVRSFLYSSQKCRSWLLSGFILLLLSVQQLSFRIVALCNHLTRIMKKGNKLPEEDGVRNNCCKANSNGSDWTFWEFCIFAFLPRVRWQDWYHMSESAISLLN